MIKSFMKAISPYQFYIHYELIFIQLLLAIVSVFFGLNLMIADILVILTSLFLFVFGKDISKNDSQKNKLLLIIKLQTTFFFMSFAAGIISSTIGQIGVSKVITMAVMILIPFVSIAVFSSNEIKGALDEFTKNNFYEYLGGSNENSGDVQLGKSENNTPIVLPYKDRFLHMLILGPTGCGKTSQIITPMICSDLKNKDMGIIVLEPKGDLAEKIYALATFEGREVMYFNPILKDCPYFNPLRGDENDVIENLVATLKAFDSDSKSYFQDSNENLIRRGVKVLKRLYGDDATLVKLDTLINNVGGKGVKMVTEFSKLKTKNERERTENDSISYWFLNDYFASGGRGAQPSKSFEAASGVRNQIQKLISNAYLNKVLNPPSQEELEKTGETVNYIDFDDILASGKICTLCSAQGKLRELANFLGFFLILQIQSAVFRRPGNENTRRGCMFYIDEFQTYANAGMQNMLTQGRSYRVGCVLATQNRALIGMNSGSRAKAFTDLVSTNARNVVIFPGANSEDAKYYSAEFGKKKVKKKDISVQRARYGIDFASQRETIKDSEKDEDVFPITEIIYREFGEAIVRIIKNNSVQSPQVVKLSYISQELNSRANKFVDELNADQIIDDSYFDEVKEEDSGIFDLGGDDSVDDLIMFEDDDVDDASNNSLY